MNGMKGTSPGGRLSAIPQPRQEVPKHHGARWIGSESSSPRRSVGGRGGQPPRRRGVKLVGEEGVGLGELAIGPDADGLRSLARQVRARYGQPVRAAIESMTGARYVHDQLELSGWEVEIADAIKVKGLAPLAC